VTGVEEFVSGDEWAKLELRHFIEVAPLIVGAVAELCRRESRTRGHKLPLLVSNYAH